MPRARYAKANRLRSGLDSGLDVLEALAASDTDMTLTSIASALQMSKSGTHGVLSTLVRRGAVVRGEDNRYRLGLRMWEIGCAASGVEIGVVAAPHMTWLAEEVSEGVIFGRMDGADVVYLHLVEGPQAVRVHASIGERIPAHCTSTGLALLAALSNSDVDARLPTRLRAVTVETLTSREKLFRELERIRSRGYSINRGGWRIDVGGVSVAVIDANGVPLGAICVAAPLYRMTKAWLQRVCPMLQLAAGRIAKQVVAAQPLDVAPDLRRRRA